MGYSARISETKFLIKEDNLEDSFIYTKDFLIKYDKKISYVEKEDIEATNNLEDLFEVFGFEIDFDSTTGHLDTIDFVWEKLGEEMILLKQIAPYVEEGSYIQWVGEDGDIWRYVFRNNIFEIIKSKIEW
jgi:hypothetical protein